MRIGIVGASGRVGTQLVEIILSSPGLELAAALVSPGSKLVGTAVAGGSVEYRPADAAMPSHCDVMIDFTTPAASLALQREIGEKRIPMVIGTTGFTREEDALLTEACAYRPMLVSANFAHGFEAFRLAVIDFAKRMPDAAARISETYHSRKKAEPSGTSRLLAGAIQEVRSRAIGSDTPPPPIDVHRLGDTVGLHEVHFDMGSAEASFNYRVHTLGAYAEGAIAAALWLISEPRAAGRYSLADSLAD